MTRKSLRILLVLLLLVTPDLFAQSIIVHPEQSETQISQGSLRAIFAMRVPQWPDGTPVHVFVLGDSHPLHILFCKSILGMFPYQLRRIWDQQIFSGTGIAPTIVSSEQEMRERVAHTKGAIGYIENIPNDNSVKLVETPL